jgi:hypothetical protein
VERFNEEQWNRLTVSGLEIKNYEHRLLTWLYFHLKFHIIYLLAIS